jgi:hypothetical protein
MRKIALAVLAGAVTAGALIFTFDPHPSRWFVPPKAERVDSGADLLLSNEFFGQPWAVQFDRAETRVFGAIDNGVFEYRLYLARAIDPAVL